MVKASIRALKLCQKVVGTEEEKWNKGMHIVYSFNHNNQGQYTLNRCAGEWMSKNPTILSNLFIMRQIFPDSQHASCLEWSWRQCISSQCLHSWWSWWLWQAYFSLLYIFNSHLFLFFLDDDLQAPTPSKTKDKQVKKHQALGNSESEQKCVMMTIHLICY